MDHEADERLTGSFTGDTLEDIVDEGVKNSHCLVGDTGVGVDLLKDCNIISTRLDDTRYRQQLTFVDVRRVSLFARLLARLLLLTVGGGGSLLSGFLRSLVGGLGRSLGGGSSGGRSLASS